MDKSKEDSISKEESDMDRVVRNNSSHSRSNYSSKPYSFWNQSYTARFSYWRTNVGRSNNTKQVYNGQGSRLTYCINCGCTPKPDQWENENSRLCIDCGGAE